MSDVDDRFDQSEVLRGLDRIEKIAKAQIIGKLPGNTGPGGTWADGKEPTQPTDEDADVSEDGDEEGGKKSDTDYKPKPSPVRKGLDDDKGDTPANGDERGPDAEDDDEDLSPRSDEDAEDSDDEDDEDLERSQSRRRGRTHGLGGRAGRRLVLAMRKSLRAMERRIERRVERALARSFARQGAFNQGLAVALKSLSTATAEQRDLLKAVAAQPARGPKSQVHAARPIEKSFDGPPDEVTLPDGTRVPRLEKAVLLQRMLTAVSKGLVASSDVVRFETTGHIHPNVYQLLVSDERVTR